MDAYLREATLEDMELLFHWANDPVVRKSAFSEKVFLYEEHQNWFKKLLDRTDCRQYIYIYKNEAIGQARIELQEDKAEIDYSICKEKRCMGHGEYLLRLLFSKVKEDFPYIQKLTAKAKKDNTASRQVFLDAGYIEKYSCFELEISGVTNQESTEIIRGGVLFLTNNNNALVLYNWLKEKCLVNIYSDKLYIEQVVALNPTIILSYNYNYIINSEIIEYMRGNIINLHISYLPWNRGFSPNIWSFIDRTPKGITIHQVDSGLDTGKIIYQKEYQFTPENETFISTYNKLNEGIVELFKEHWDDIFSGRYTMHEQGGKGSYHTMKDLEQLKSHIEFDWSDNVGEFLKKL